MASSFKRESLNGDEYEDPAGAKTAAAQESLKARLSRKRTKTGCLTCRKRRIKCGEEHPVCRNCVKSKRHCEGYNQRVVFREPFYDFQPGPNGAAHITFQAGILPGPSTPFYTDFSHAAAGYAFQGQLQPRPVEQFVSYADQAHPQHSPPQPLPQPPPIYGRYKSFGAPPPGAAMPLMPMVPQQQPMMQPSFVHQPPYETVEIPQHRTLSHSPMEMRRESVATAHAAQAYVHTPPGFTNGPTGPLTQPPPPIKQEMQWIQEDPSSAMRMENAQVPRAGHPAEVLAAHERPREVPHYAPASAAYAPRPELCRPIDYQSPSPSNGYMETHQHTQAFASPSEPRIANTTLDYYDREFHIQPTQSSTDLLTRAAVEVHDVDYYDVDTDEEMDTDGSALITTVSGPQQALGRILQSNNIAIQDLQTRRYDTFLYDGMLDVYRVDEHANPLRNPATARVFAHFIAVTGPSLSIFERHPRNTSVLFAAGQVPFSQQGLWTYTMPLAALRNQGLLHAMLALASLHIARLTGAPVTPSIQHYAWALKRIHHCVGHKGKRLNITTIAATMLLGFYEIMTADHMKWNMHLAGAKQLFVETDFVGMMQQFRRMRQVAAWEERMHQRRPSVPHSFVTNDERLQQIPDVDERVISEIVGKEIRYGTDQGQVMTPGVSIPQELDLGKFEILKDLFWWYCKQDAYQSIVSGNHLLMDYSRWANCPPRAPLGRADAVYGSVDHLMLLLGRVADFAARDRARKLQQIELNGGQWRPAPGMQMPRPPQQQPPTPVFATGPPYVNGYHPHQARSQPSPPIPPPFFGMAPPPNPNVQMPSAYHPIHSMPTPQSATSHEPLDLQLATNAALEEHSRIRAALFDFSQRLGNAFKTLTPDQQPTLETSFGPALFYRSFDIGCLWAIYHMAMIVALRSHPHMPPAAHMAAGVAAPQTAFHAAEIGRTVAGIVPGAPDHPLNPSLGAALCESCMPSFFAAVQYQDPHQRRETVLRIFSIAQRTGFGTAEIIANGCETAWVKAAAAGRGPPYARVARSTRSTDPRLNGSWEHQDPNAKPGDDERDRRHVRVNPSARLNWAIGIMGTEEDEGVR
ncbi:hypothetical protein LTR53_012373 [Teratosphaeriaceae sp. CCFEE 6253]|nr:hypothetical protein LTR53_012373 [Teratosphaeriaceae sp. CCFEE 6253]